MHFLNLKLNTTLIDCLPYLAINQKVVIFV